MVDKTIFRCIVLGFKGTEQSFLSTENLYCTSWMFCEAQQTASVADQPCSNKFPHESSEVGSNRIHAVSEVFSELSAVGGDGDNLVAEGIDVGNIGV